MGGLKGKQVERLSDWKGGDSPQRRERGRKGKWRRIRFAGKRIRPPTFSHRTPLSSWKIWRRMWWSNDDKTAYGNNPSGGPRWRFWNAMIRSEENESAPLCCTASDGSWWANGKVKSFNVFIIHCCLVRDRLATSHPPSQRSHSK